MGIVYRLAALSSALLLIAAAVAFFTANPFDRPAARDSSTTSAPALPSTDDFIATLEAQLQLHPGAADRLSQLGFAYLQKTRETGDPSYYAPAESAFRQVLSSDPNNAEGIRGMGSLALARHDFRQALRWGQQAVQLAPGSARSYGVLGDALVELGRYSDAENAFQTMADVRPDLSSYARISYVRELNGDVDGAIEAMQLAVEAGGPRGENAAWVRLQLGNLLFGKGDLDGAQAQYQRALDAFPGYVHALAGLAKVRAARGDHQRAISLYNQVVQRYPVPEYVIALGDNYRAVGNDDDATRQYDLVSAIDKLYRANGVNSDLELALYYADHDIQLDDALRQARAEYERRPSIQAADILAWALYKNGRASEAAPLMQQALALGTKDARFFFHAGMIDNALGQSAPARDLLDRALKTNPYFSVLQAPDARQALAVLTAGNQSAEAKQ